ncbi:MAG TPA: hypothetical protein VMI11_14760 [Actinomycetes bacterium]|nr:hypothetical protein [Actinomycetes bacterium]
MPIAPFVPDELTREPFRGSHAVRAGLLSRTNLESRAWTRLFRDVYVHRGVELTSDVRVAAARLAAGEQVLAGRTAAYVHGLWSPPPNQLVPIELARPRPESGTGLDGARRSRRVWPVDDDDVVEVDGIAVTSTLRTAFDLVRVRQLVEGVVVVDAFAHGGAFSVEEFAAYAARHVRWPGVRRARLAAAHADARAQSPGETRTRMVAVLSGFPRPKLQVEIVVPGGVRFLDLLLVGVPRRVGIEFDGGMHLEEARRRGDLRRENAIYVETGTPLLRYDSYSLDFERHVMAHEMARASGFTGLRALSDRDFDRGPRAQRW